MKLGPLDMVNPMKIRMQKMRIISPLSIVCILVLSASFAIPAYANPDRTVEGMYQAFVDGIANKDSGAIKNTMLVGPVAISYVDKATRGLDTFSIPARGWANRSTQVPGKSIFKTFPPRKYDSENGLAASMSQFVFADQRVIGSGFDVALYVNTNDGWRFLSFNRTWLKKDEKVVDTVAKDTPDSVVNKLIEAINAKDRKAFRKCFLNHYSIFANRNDLLDGKLESTDSVDGFSKRFKGMSSVTFEIVNPSLKVYDSHVAYFKGEYTLKVDDLPEETGTIMMGLLVGDGRKWTITSAVRS